MKFEQAEELSFVITESMRMAKFSYEKYKATDCAVALQRDSDSARLQERRQAFARRQ